MVWGSLHMRRTNDMITKPVRGAKPLDLFIAASSLHRFTVLGFIKSGCDF